MKKVFLGIILLVICTGLVIYHEIKLNKGYNTNIHDITNSATKKEGINVYLDATFIAGTIKFNDDHGYYVVFGDGVQYIVYMSNKDANEINKYLLDRPDDSYQIKGVTKAIPDELIDDGKKFVNEWLNTNHNHEESENHDSHDITTDDFYHYFGYVYLDNIVENDLLIKIIIYITGITGALIIISLVFRKHSII